MSAVARMRWIVACTVLFMLQAVRAEAQTPLVMDPAQPRMAAFRNSVYYKDEARSMDLVAAQSRLAAGQFQAGDGKIPTHGLTSSDFWFFFQVIEKKPGRERWFVTVEFPNMDWLDIYFLMPDGRIETRRSGDRLDFSHRDLQTRFFNFEIPNSVGLEPVGVMIRARTSGAMNMPIYVEEMASIMRNDHHLQLFFGTIWGSMLIMAFYYILMGLHARHLEHLYLGSFFFTVMIYRASYHGYVFEYLLPSSPEFANLLIPLSSSSALLLTGLFSGKFLDIAQYPRLNRIYRATVGLLGAMVIASLIFDYSLIAFIIGLGVLTPLLWIACGIHALRHGFKPARYFVAAWTMPLLATFFFNLSNFGLLEGSLLMINFLEVGLMSLILLMSFAASEKINEMNRATKIAQQQALEAQVVAREATESLNTQLEKNVRQRTRELFKQTREMKVILDNVQQGICTMDRNLWIQPQHSKELNRFFEEPLSNERSVLTTFFARTALPLDDLDGMNSALGSAFDEDRMAFDINSHLLPREVRLKQKDSLLDLELDWAPIEDDAGVVSAVLLTIKDVTELKKVAAAVQSQKRDMEIVSRIIHVPSLKMNMFLDHAAELLSQSEKRISIAFDESTWVDTLRSLHTVKGNARTYGFHDISSAVHESEDLVLRVKGRWNDPDALTTCLEELAKISKFIGEYREINDKVLNRGEIAQIERTFGRFSQAFFSVWPRMAQNDQRLIFPKVYELNQLLAHRFSSLLAPLIASLKALSRQLQKNCPEVVIEGDDFDVKNEEISKVEAIFMHMFRNSLDHGFPADFSGQVRISVTHTASATVIAYSDNGRGLALERLRAKGLEAGLIGPDAGDDEVGLTIFAAGISSAQKVTDISGRGIGMNAVQQFVKDLGGQITIRLGKPGREPGYRQVEFCIDLPRQISLESWDVQTGSAGPKSA